MLINGKQKVGTEDFKNQKAFIDYSQTIDQVHENLEDHISTKRRRVLIVFDDMIADIKSKKKLSPILIELFLRGRKLNISLVFISQSYFKVSKTIRLNEINYLIKNSSKGKLQQIASNHLSDIRKAFMKLYQDYAKEPFSFLVNGITFSSDNPQRFRMNVL